MHFWSFSLSLGHVYHAIATLDYIFIGKLNYVSRGRTYEMIVNRRPRVNGKLKEHCSASEVITRCPDPADIAYRFFMPRHLCHHSIITVLGLNQHLGVCIPLFNFGHKILALTTTAPVRQRLTSRAPWQTKKLSSNSLFILLNAISSKSRTQVQTIILFF